MTTASNAAQKALPTQLSETATIREWVDALVGGSCSKIEFLRHMRHCGHADSDPIWEALSQLDQAFRNHRLERDLYLPIKSVLQQYALGRGESALQVAAAAPGAVSASEAQKPEVQPVVVSQTDIQQSFVDSAAAPGAAAPEAVAVPALAPIRIGSVLRGRYRIIGQLASGAAGTVVEAIDELRADAPEVSQRIAIRILEPQQLQSQEQLAAYLRHVCKLQTLSHPNLVRLFNFDQDGGRAFLTMELLAGSTLDSAVAPSALPLRAALDRHHIVKSVASALHYIHAQGVAHGDLNSESVFITHQGDLRVLGLEASYLVDAQAVSKDHWSFAALAYDLLSKGPKGGKLVRPDGVTNEQWQTLKAVLEGNSSQGPALLRAFAIEGAKNVPKSGGGAKWRWASLALLPLAAAGYFAYQQYGSVWPPLPTSTARATAQVPAPAPQATVVPSVAATIEPSITAVEPEPASDTPASTENQSTAPLVESQAAAPTISSTPQRPMSVARVSLVGLERDIVQVEDSQTVARIRVLRTGSTAKPVDFVWWTENGSAQPGVDFNSVTPRAAQIPERASSVELFVPLVPDRVREQPRTFYVKIDEVGVGGELGERTLAQVVIVPQGYVAPAIEEESTVVGESTVEVATPAIN